MRDFPSLAEVLAAHEWRGDFLGCACRWNWPDERTHFCGEDERIAKAHIVHQADAWREACTITTHEQLLEMPVDAVVLSAHKIAYQHDESDVWHEVGTEMSGYSSNVELPALLIWHPEWPRT